MTFVGIVRAKLTSFYALRDAGEWLKANTPPETLIMGGNVAQLTYYSERRAIDFPRDLQAFQALAGERRPGFVVVSKHAKGPDWLGGVKRTPVMKNQPERPSAIVLRLEP